MLDPEKAYISLSETAGRLLRKLGIFSDSDSVSDIKSHILGAVRAGDVTTVESTKEMHYLADARLGGVHCFLICVCSAGSPAGNKEFTTIIKGVMLPQDAKELIRIGKGLAPIGRAISQWRRDERTNEDFPNDN